MAHCWIEITPCNWNHQKLAEKVKAGIRAAGGTPIEFNTISVTDGIAMGTEGMKASLISRDWIADSVELVVRGHLLDGLVTLTGCDKTIPAMVMAMARLNIPSVMLYGGSIMYGEHRGRRLTVQDVFEAIGAFNAGKIDAAELNAIESRACPGAGACGGQFTANTMATAFEMLGRVAHGLERCSRRSIRARRRSPSETGRLVMDVLRKGLRPRDIITKKSLQNAIAGVMATGGSTNAVLHLMAVAREAGVKLTIDEFDRISRRPRSSPTSSRGAPTPRPRCTRRAAWASSPSGSWPPASSTTAEMTVTGRTIAEEARAAREAPGQKVIRPLNDPLKSEGGIVILRGNLAPDGCVAKVSGQKRDFHRGPARIFDREEDAFQAVKAGKIKANDVVVIRWEGPKGGPGHARDAARHGRHPGRRPGRQRGPDDRRSLLGSHPRLHDRPHRPGGRRGWPHRGPQERRHRSSSTSRNASSTWSLRRRRSRSA